MNRKDSLRSLQELADKLPDEDLRRLEYFAEFLKARPFFESVGTCRIMSSRASIEWTSVRARYSGDVPERDIISVHITENLAVVKEKR